MSADSRFPDIAGQVEDLIANERVVTFFQPIVAIQTKSILGFEAFSRGVDKSGESRIEARVLFGEGWNPEQQLQIDRICRKSALKSFLKILSSRARFLLFLNMNADILKFVDGRYGWLARTVEEMGIPPENVVIEFAAPKIDAATVSPFVSYYKDRGFRFSVEGVGVGSRIFDLLIVIRPDFVKLNRSFFKGRSARDEVDFITPLVRFSAQAGCKVIGQGVESEEESLDLLHADVHLQQGYHYTKDDQGGGALNADSPDPAKLFFDKIDTIYQKYRDLTRAKIQETRGVFEKRNALMRKVTQRMARASEKEYEAIAHSVAMSDERIVSAFVLNDKGVQLTRRAMKRAFAPHMAEASEGGDKLADHSLKDYFLHLELGYEKYVTTTILSPVANMPSCIIAHKVYATDSRMYVLCVEFLAG